MRDLEDLGPFDAVASLYTAFGFLGEAGDRETLYQAAAALRPGGRLVLDLTNFAGYLAHLPVDVWRETDDAVLREWSNFDAARGVLVSGRTRFLKAGGQETLPESEVRAYLPHEVLALLRAADLTVERTAGSLAGEPFQWDRSPDQVYVCVKPG